MKTRDYATKRFETPLRRSSIEQSLFSCSVLYPIEISVWTGRQRRSNELPEGRDLVRGRSRFVDDCHVQRISRRLHTHLLLLGVDSIPDGTEPTTPIVYLGPSENGIHGESLDRWEEAL